MAEGRTNIALIGRFGVAGIANTAVGLASILALDLGLGVEPHLANAAGYGVGLIFSFWLNRRFVFRSEARARSSGPRFALAAGLCFAANQLALTAGRAGLGSGEAARIVEQLLGMSLYAGLFFLCCRYWVFGPPPVQADAKALPRIL